MDSNFHTEGDSPIGRNHSSEDFSKIVDDLYSRRSVFKKLGVGALFSSITGLNSAQAQEPAPEVMTSGEGLTFKEVKRSVNDRLHVPEDYEADVLLRWGDPLFSGLEEFDPKKITAEDQLKRFGYNNDFVGFLPLPFGSNNSNHGLLTVNHEFTSSQLMHEGSPTGYELTEEQVALHQAAHGLSVVEIKCEDGKWRVILDSPYNRRITPNTEMEMTGPVRKSKRLLNDLSDGVKTWGTYGNCAGSVTPWGTVLSGEENCHFYFMGNPTKTNESSHYERLGIKGHYKKKKGSERYNYYPVFPWGRFDDRFNVDKVANAPLHAGWVIEVDPFDPNSVPKKRTALGRFRHEGCSIIVTEDGSVVAYTGDDQKFEYIYKFVSSKKYKPDDRAHNMTLLDEGTLYAAKFSDDKSLTWLPLIYGEGKLTEEYGFTSQGDVCIDCRKAADLMNATPMDRPEDIEVNQKTGVVYAMLTNNDKRDRISKNVVNPREENSFGHIIEMIPPNLDHTSDSFTWDFFILAGDVNKAEHETLYHKDTTKDGWFIAPDNCAFDNQGRIWISTDGGSKFGISDGVWVSETTGPSRALSKSFLQTPTAAELCGPFFTPDNTSFFCAVQHPGEGSSYSKPSTRWPDFDPNMPPRPSVVVIQKQDGGIVGT